MNTGTDLAISGSVAVLVVLLSMAFNRFRQTCGAQDTVRGFQGRFRLGLVTFLVLFFALSTAKAQVGRVIAQKTFPSVVMLMMEGADGEGSYLGSGFFVREGIVATNFHVVKGSAKGFARVLGQKTEYEVEGIVGIDRERDLVLLSVPGAKAPSLPFGDSSRVAAGDDVYVVGNPEGLEGTFSQGIVSAIRLVGSRTLIQVTAPISPGSSGGPVLNSRGEVIGIAVATLESGQNLNFAVPVSYLASLLAQISPVGPLLADSEPTEPPRMRWKPPRSEAAPFEAQPKVGSHSQRCAQLVDAGRDFERAELECRAAVEAEPQNADLHVRLSYALSVQLKYGKAIEMAREAVRLNPSNEIAHLYLGISLREEGQHAQMDDLINKAWEAAEAGAEVVGGSGKTDWDEYRKVRLDEAFSEFRAALRLNPDDDMAHYNLGIMFVYKGDVNAAITEYREALRVNPNNDQAHVGLAYVLGGSKRDLNGAVAEMRAAVQLDPDNPWHHYNLAHWLETKGDRHGALEEYRTAYTLDPQNSILRGFYESFLRETNAAHEQDKLQHWLGTWVFVGPVKQLTACAPNTFVPTDVPNYSFKILTISPSGEVAAQAEHPATAGESKAESIRNPKPDWSGSATDRSLVLTMDPIPPGTVLTSSYLQAVKELADADRNYAKVLKDMEEYYQPYKGLLSRLKDRIGRGKSVPAAGAQPAPAPQPGGTTAKLKEAAGRLEAHREGDRYSVEFTYYEAWSWGDMDCHTTKKFLGSMGRP